MTNKRRKRKKLMVLVEVYGGQRSLAFELTTEKAIFKNRKYIKHHPSKRPMNASLER